MPENVWSRQLTSGLSEDVYFSADVETDGPIPGPFSMLSFAIVYAGRFDGRGFRRPAALDQHIYAELKPISEEFEPDALRVNRLDRERLGREGQEPNVAMSSASAWIRRVAGEGRPVLVAYPLSFDWSWLYWYFIQFSNDGSPFNHSRCYDIKTAVAVKSRRPIVDSGREALPSFLRRQDQHSHHALDDAIEQARSSQTSSNGRGQTVSFLEQRRTETNRRLKELPTHLSELARLLDGRGCLYVTGSYGRRDAGQNSDLDAFVVVDDDRDLPDHAVIESHLGVATKALKIKPFKAKPEHPVVHHLTDLVEEIGSEHDDHKNTFTARLLLLLESQPVLGVDVYERALARVIDAYWLDYTEHCRDFLPGFLANDILRMWRTFCVNYEARTEKEPDENVPSARSKTTSSNTADY